MTLNHTASPEVPALSSDVLTLSTDIDSEMMSYQQSGNDLVMPETLEINANLRYVSGSVSSSNQGTFSPRTHVLIAFITSANRNGNVLFIGENRLFLLNGPDNLGPSVNVDTTTTFHDYRITVNGTSAGSTINVFQDGILVLNGTTLRWSLQFLT